MRVYLSSRYSRRLELCNYADELRSMGFDVQARWLLGDAQRHGDAAASAVIEETVSIPVDEGRLFAVDDLEDIMMADLFIAFTENSRAHSKARGGRHVEFGYALAIQDWIVGWSAPGVPRILTVGPLENIFYTLEGIEHVYDWENAKLLLKAHGK